jgi:hypothetical protein
MEAMKYRGVIPPVMTTSMGQATQQKRRSNLLDLGECWKATHKIGFKGIA